MPKTLTIRYVIPLADKERDGIWSSNRWVPKILSFKKWIPKAESDILIRERGNLTARLWIDESCIATPTVDGDDVSWWVYVPVDKVRVDVTASNVADDLARFIYDDRDSTFEIRLDDERNVLSENQENIGPEVSEKRRLQEAYGTLGLQVFTAALTIFNRLIVFVRAVKNQYWLYERPIDPNTMSLMNEEFHAMVRSENYDWVRWRPSRFRQYVISSAAEETSINQAEWAQVQEFVASDSRQSLVFELLASAQLLADEGHRRSAVIEAATALEIAVFTFASNPKLAELTSAKMLGRFDSRQLHSQIRHVGFSSSVKFILPLLFPSEILPDEIIQCCQDVIQIRNNVVHRGQRDVKSEKIRALVVATRKACEIIVRYTG